MRSIEELFAPHDVGAFLRRTYGSTFRILEGRAGKLASLLSWADLDQIFASPRFDTANLKLIRDGADVPPASYVDPAGNVDPEILRARLADGAALLVTAAHTMHRGLWDLTRVLAGGLRDAVNANVYAGQASSRGFDLHIDHHDVLVLQVVGRKRWWVYPPTLEHPLVLPEHATEPPAAPLWEGVLEDGDILYLPRGFWHRAEGIDDAPTLHVSCGIQPCTGLHFLGWLRQQLLDAAPFRQDLPRFGSPEQLASHMRSLREALANRWTDALAEEYVRFHEARISRELDALERELWG